MGGQEERPGLAEVAMNNVVGLEIPAESLSDRQEEGGSGGKHPDCQLALASELASENAHISRPSHVHVCTSVSIPQCIYIYIYIYIYRLPPLPPTSLSSRLRSFKYGEAGGPRIMCCKAGWPMS